MKRKIADVLREEDPVEDVFLFSEEDLALLEFMRTHGIHVDGPGDWRPIVREIKNRYSAEENAMRTKRHALAESLRSDSDSDVCAGFVANQDDEPEIIIQVPAHRIEPWWFTHSQVPVINMENQLVENDTPHISGNVVRDNGSNQNGIVYKEVQSMSNMPNEDAIAARRRALAEALRNGDDVVVTASGEVEFPEEAQATDETAIQVPNAKLA